MEGQNFYALSLEQCLLELEPHHFGAIGLAICTFIIALYCAITNSLGNLFGLLFVVMASFTGLAVTNAKIAVVLTLLSHIIVFHTVLLSAYSHIKLFVGTLYKTLDKYYQVCYNQRQLKSCW